MNDSSIAVDVEAPAPERRQHPHFLTGFRNRIAVAMHWCWNHATFQHGTRLITGISSSGIEDVIPVLSTAPALAVSAGDSGGTLP